MNNLCTDIGWQSLNKHGEILCGDRVEVVEGDRGETIIVLADGLGSGVKASILSTLTAKIISTMIASAMSLEDCVQAIAATLPVCEVRKIAYSTFTIIHITGSSAAEVIQFDNPHVILLRNGKHYEFPKMSQTIDGKVIYKSQIALREDDVLIAVSDGAIHAGVGKTLNFGWQRDDIISFMEKSYSDIHTARTLTATLLDQCNSLYGYEPGDDTTVCTVRIRGRKQINLMLGPPSDPSDDNRMMSLFFSKEGKRIVCGGTTSGLAANFLGSKIITDLKYIDPAIPPIAKVKGIDLVTEGVITINQVLLYAKDYMGENKLYSHWKVKNDGASMIARMLFEEATDINFYVGRAINSAHQNPDLPIGFNIKMRLVEELSESLKEMGKRIKVSYF